MRKIFFAISFIIISFFIKAQTNNLHWVRNFPAISNSEAVATDVDYAGNVYTIGKFTGTTDFDPGTGVFNLTGSSIDNLFILKLDSVGNFIWAKQIGGAPYDIVIDYFGNVIITGVYLNTVDFDPGVGVFNLTNPFVSTNEGFILKLDQNGNFVWARRFGGDGSDRGNVLKVNGLGEIFLSGDVKGSNINFSGSFPASVLGQVPFVAKLNASGAFLFVTYLSYNGTSSTYNDVFSMDIDGSNNQVALCYYTGTVTCGSNTYTTTLGSYSMYITKTDAVGNLVWSKGLSDVTGNAISIDNASNTYITGIFNNTVDFDPGIGTYTINAAATLQQHYILKLSSNGSFIWVKNFGGTGSYVQMPKLLYNKVDKLYLTSGFADIFDLDPGVGNYNIGTTGTKGSFITIIDTAGAFINGFIKTNFDSRANGFALSNSDEIITSGSFVGSANFNPNGNPYNITSIGSDIFIHKIGGCLSSIPSPINITPAANQSICSNQTTTLSVNSLGLLNWYSSPTSTMVISTNPSIITSTLSAGTYTYYVESKICSLTSSLTPIIVNVNPVPVFTVASTPNIICTNQTTTLNVSGASTYSWSNGATSSSIVISPTTTTDYSVVGTGSNGCVSTYTLTANLKPNITVSANTSSVCSGSVAQLWPMGGTTYTCTSLTTNTITTSSTIYVYPDAATTYTVYGENQYGCTNSNTVNVATYLAPVGFYISGPNTRCTNTSITLYCMGASNCVWSNSATTTNIVVSPTLTTTYSVNALPSGSTCTFTAVKTVSVFSAPTITVNATATVVCAGTSITLTGGGATTYTWSGGISNGVAFIPPTGSTTYTVTGTNAEGCMNTATQLITVNTPTVTANATATVVCAGTSITLTGGGAVTYTWSGGVSNGVAFIPPIGSTTYTVTGTSANGCTNSAIVIPSVAICSGVCFTTPSASPFAVGTKPRSVINADVNADGLTDLVTANVNSNNVSVLIAVGGGSFAPAVNFTVGTNPYSVTSADFNTDGKVDLAVANRNSNNVSVLFGNGAGNFAAAVNFSVGTFPFSVTSADFNADGKVDLVTANQGSNDVSILLGNGAGSFAPTVSFAVGTNPLSVTSADFNADGKADLATANINSNNVSVLIAIGGGSFAPAVNLVVGMQPWSVTSADFNADGKIDIAASNNGSNNVSVLLGNGGGSFSTAVHFTVGTQPFSVISSDFNSDGKADIATANSGSSNVSVLLGNGGGSFATAINFAVGTNPGAVTSADFNADGKADLAVANSSNNNVSILLNVTSSVTANSTATAICAGTGITLTGGGATTYTWSSGVTDGVSFIPPTGSTTYTVTGANMEGCRNTATQLITVNALPTISVNSRSICSGQSFTMTPSGASTYSYSNGSAVVTPTTNSTYTVVGANVAGCLASAVSSVTVNTTPTISVNSGAICASQSFAMIPSGASTYTYSSGSAVVTPTLNSSYNVTGTSAQGCVSSNTAVSSITVNALPTITVNSGVICVGQSFTMTPSGASTYAYSNGSDVTTPTINDTYTVTGTDANACTNTAVSSVSVNALPNITVNSGAVCSGQSFTIIPNGANTYTYSGGSDVVSPSADASYSVSGTDANGCISAIDAVSTVNVNATPTITVNSGAICSGDNFTLTPGGANTYTFSSGGNIVSPLNNTSYTVTGSSGNGCSNSAVSSVTVNATPTITVNNGAICSGQSFTIIPNGANTYTYSNGSDIVTPTTSTSYTVSGSDANGCIGSDLSNVAVNALPIITVNNGPICSGQSFTIIPNGANTYTYSGGSDVVSPSADASYSVSGTDANGCVSAIDAVSNVTVNGLPSLSITGTNTICLGSSTSFGVSGANSYTWSSGNTGTNETVNPTTNTTYSVTGTDLNNCSSSQTVSLTVNNTCADVWPGDANSDGTADNLDVLELGLHYTQTGAARASISNIWQSYYSTNWAGNITNGKNLNHSDCNGDGVINNDDTLAIYNNYGLTHAFKTAQTTTVNPQLSIVPDQASVIKGTWGSASVYLGDATNTINNINGLAFTVDFDNALLETNSIYIEYQNSFIDASQNLHFRKLDFANGKICTATTHTVTNNVNGFGKIATLHYQIKSSLATDEVLIIGVSQVNQSDASGLITPLTSGTGTLMAVGASVGIKEFLNNGDVSISPNPTNGLLTITSSIALQNIEVTNVAGQVLLSQLCNAKSQILQLQSFAEGIYFVKVVCTDGMNITKKVVVNR